MNGALGRRGVIGAAALGLVAAGTGVWAWRRQRGEAAIELLDLVFDTPGGDRLALRTLAERYWVLNFWATWCPPCVREMPALDRFARDHATKGWQVVGIAADEADPVRAFVASRPVSFPIGLAGFAGIGLSRQLGNLSGGLPFTVLVAPGGKVLHRHMGETRYEQLAAWAKGIA
jgi:thiol-disulfide isomerase/thioredoxin